MKKNKVMRLASALMALALLTTCAVSGTFAKYVTSTTGNDKARVAYWGFDQAAEVDFDLFHDTYRNGYVKSSGEVDAIEDVVAPSANGQARFAFGYTNYKTDLITAPEVAYTFKVDLIAEGDYSMLDENPNFVWALSKNGVEYSSRYQTVAELVAAVKALSGDASGEKLYMPGELPENFTAADEVYQIGWSWRYSTDEESDAYDTEMGNMQELDDVHLTILVSATQA